MPIIVVLLAQTPSPAPDGGHAARLPASVGITLIIAILAVVIIGGLIWSRRDSSTSKAIGDKDLEALRIGYGFWLIISALVLTVTALVVILTAFAPDAPKTTDVVAIIAAVTGVFGTLTAAFFGIQAAGAGRSQALSALSDQLRGQASDGASGFKLDPPYGPHVGNTRVSINGNGFTGGTAVNFGTTPGTNFEFVNDGLVRATTPPAPDGVNDVKAAVIFPAATPANRDVGTFYYYTITNAHGPATGGNTVAIRGSGLNGANGVMFGTVAATGVASTADGVTLVAPPGDANCDVDVTVTFPVSAPTSSFVVGKYHYDAAPTASPP